MSKKISNPKPPPKGSKPPPPPPPKINEKQEASFEDREKSINDLIKAIDQCNALGVVYHYDDEGLQAFCWDDNEGVGEAFLLDIDFSGVEE